MLIMNHTRRNIIKTISALAGATLLPLTGEAKTSDNHLLKQRNQIFNTDLEDLDELINLFDFEKKAEQLMTKMAWEFVASGAADEITLKWNREAFDKIKI